MNNEEKLLSKSSVKNALNCIEYVSDLIFRIDKIPGNHDLKNIKLKCSKSSIYSFKDHKEGLNTIKKLYLI